VFAASSSEIEDACLTAPAIPRGAAAWQDRPAAIPEVRILVEKSAPFPRQSHARDAVLCEMFMLWLWRWCGREVPLPVRAGRSKETISYQFQCDVVVYIMAGAGVVRLRWRGWLTNNLRRPQPMSGEVPGIESKLLYVQWLIQPQGENVVCGRKWMVLQ
jgi:hypothetical protein